MTMTSLKKKTKQKKQYWPNKYYKLFLWTRNESLLLLQNIFLAIFLLQLLFFELRFFFFCFTNIFGILSLSDLTGLIP